MQRFVSFEQSDQFEYPKYKQSFGPFNAFPMVNDIAFKLDKPFDVDDDEENEYIIHPIVQAIKDGGQIESVEVVGSWSDDRCPCLDVAVVVNGKKYGVSFWWLSQQGVSMIYKAETNQAKYVNSFKEEILLQSD